MRDPALTHLRIDLAKLEYRRGPDRVGAGSQVEKRLRWGERVAVARSQ